MIVRPIEHVTVVVIIDRLLMILVAINGAFFSCFSVVLYSHQVNY